MSQPEVRLLSYTHEPLKVVAAAQLNMLGDMRMSLNDISEHEAEELFSDVLKTTLQGSLEAVHFYFQMKGLSRAFQQQLTRTRHSSYNIESLRFFEVSDLRNNMYVGEGPYTAAQEDMIDDLLHEAEKTYKNLIASGVPVQDARNLLPLGTHSKIGWSVDLKTLNHMSRVRLCTQSQEGEWGKVFTQIMDELEGVHPMLADGFGPFCERGEVCPFGSMLDRPCPKRYAPSQA